MRTFITNRARLLLLGLSAVGVLPAASPSVAAPAGRAANAPASTSASSTSGAAEAEFEVVASGDDLYRLLGAVQRGGLLKSAPRGGATRYEVALQAGRATLALASRRAAGTRVSDEATRALSLLVERLRPELVRLEVDVEAALALCRGQASRSDAAVSVLLSPRAGTASGAPGSRGSAGGASGLPTRLAPGADGASMRLSERLRVSAAVSSRARDASDPFGDAAARRPLGALATNRAGAAEFEMPGLSRGLRSGPDQVAAGASYDVAEWLRLRAAYQSSAAQARAAGVLGALRTEASPSPEALLLAPGAPTRSVGGGVDIDLPAGLTLSGDVSRLGASLPAGAARPGTLGASLFGPGGFEGTRYAAGARVSGFDNRLALSLNWSLLKPEERSMLERSSAGLNLGVGSDRFRLNVLYQQLFGPEARGQANRVIAGGVNISF